MNLSETPSKCYFYYAVIEGVQTIEQDISPEQQARLVSAVKFYLVGFPT